MKALVPLLIGMITMIIAVTAHCQDGERQAEITRLAEDLVGTPEDDDTFEASFEGLLQTLSRPLNLNETNIESLLSLGLLTQEQFQAIHAYRSKNGDFVSVYELQAVPGLPLDVIEKLRPFVTVKNRSASIDRSLVRRIRAESDNYLIMRLSRAWNAGEDHPPYTGSAEHLLLRFRSQRPGDFSFGFNTEKDPGEPIEWNGRSRYYGFDRWSFHAQLQNKGVIKNLIVGDLQAQFGQGLVFGGAFGPGKGAETITTMRRVNVGIVPYTSAYEAGNMRGIGLTLSLPLKLELTLICSRALRDASVDTLNGKAVTRSIQKSGLHRTVGEMEARQRIHDTQIGVVLSKRIRTLEAGLIFDRSSFEIPVTPNEAKYNQYAFRGTILSHVGIFFTYNTGRLSTFGEFTKELGRGTGSVLGILGSITKGLDVALLARNYAPDFQTRFTNGISENSTPTNERGIYLGWRHQFNRKISLTGYLDLFSFPWLRYRAYSPSFGHEWLWRFSYQPSRNVMIFLQAREEFKARNSSFDQAAYVQNACVKHNYWIHAETGLRELVRFITKLQISRFSEHGTATTGLALSQDVSLKVKGLQLVARYALFDAEDYDNRLYTYENDVLFAYSMPAYNGTGIRKMIMLQYNITRHLTVWARYAETTNILPEYQEPGQTGRHYSVGRDVRFQLRIQF
ncbi:helix-hairpin-helix domain-containing protein [Chryseolinea sp. T2]|uniref:ComEA family DNA-binding protein n=1 Tax=Chryseolinea sp. T2 TaxID=3129255 RepID=UPI003076FF53